MQFAYHDNQAEEIDEKKEHHNDYEGYGDDEYDTEVEQYRYESPPECVINFVACFGTQLKLTAYVKEAKYVDEVKREQWEIVFRTGNKWFSIVESDEETRPILSYVIHTQDGKITYTDEYTTFDATFDPYEVIQWVKCVERWL